MFTIKVDEEDGILIDVDGQWISLGTLVDGYRAHCDTLTCPKSIIHESLKRTKQDKEKK